MDGVETGPYEIGNKVTDTGGNFDIAGTQVAKLTGPYVEMRDLYVVAVKFTGVDNI